MIVLGFVVWVFLVFFFCIVIVIQNFFEESFKDQDKDRTGFQPASQQREQVQKRVSAQNQSFPQSEIPQQVESGSSLAPGPLRHCSQKRSPSLGQEAGHSSNWPEGENRTARRSDEEIGLGEKGSGNDLQSTLRAWKHCRVLLVPQGRQRTGFGKQKEWGHRASILRIGRKTGLKDSQTRNRIFLTFKISLSYIPIFLWIILTKVR